MPPRKLVVLQMARMKFSRTFLSPFENKSLEYEFVQSINIKRINFSVEKWNLHDVHVIVDVQML